MKGDVEVTPNGDDWIVQIQDGDPDVPNTVVGVYPIQEEAELRGRQYADEWDVELFIKGEDGRIREKDSHGNDPPEIKG